MASYDRDIKKLVDAILKEIGGIEAIYLFGSIAKGTETERSDYDIAVIVREYPVKDIDVIAKIRYSLLGKIKRPLEIFFMDMKDLEYPSPVLYEIYHAHELLFGKDVLSSSEKAVKAIKPIIEGGIRVGYHV